MPANFWEEMEPSKTDRLLLIARQYTEAIAQCRAALMNGTAGDAGICWQTEILDLQIDTRIIAR